MRTSNETKREESNRTNGAVHAKRSRQRRRVIRWSVIVAFVVVTVVVRMAVVRTYYAATDAVAPEIPKNARMLVYKLSSSYQVGQIIVYRQGKTSMLARVVGGNEGADELTVGRNAEENRKIQVGDVIGRVILNTRYDYSLS